MSTLSNIRALRKLAIEVSATLKTSTYSILATDGTIICTANSFTVTLLTAVGNSGKKYCIKNIGNGIITINTTGGQTIDNFASGVITLSQYTALTVKSDGTNWIII